MSLRVAQSCRSSWLCGCRAARGFSGRQSQRVVRSGLQDVRALGSSVKLSGDDKITHTGQVRGTSLCEGMLGYISRDVTEMGE